MSRFQGKYALVQYCPVPERLEFVNIGLLLVVPESSYLEIRFAKGQTRVERLFGKQSKAHLDRSRPPSSRVCSINSNSTRTADPSTSSRPVAPMRFVSRRSSRSW
jgi:hypothetical protein